MAIELTAEKRTEFGKERCKKLRARNILPGNLYGGDFKEPVAIQLELNHNELVIKRNGKRAEYVLNFEGKTIPVRIEEIRYEPVMKAFKHLDFVVKS
ncbi:MAG: hypothetical protein H7A35_08145 [Planctomycetales bacterium]|nr:hypothetical protein [bacterium]UNM06856.1 MAG: hypothetical protein H7A35_08145 [Planctomycetales bacterium]